MPGLNVTHEAVEWWDFGESVIDQLGSNCSWFVPPDFEYAASPDLSSQEFPVVNNVRGPSRRPFFVG